MSEKNFWNLLRINLEIPMYRVENRVASGMPDIHYINNGNTGWIELKYLEEFPKKGKMRIGLRQSQHLWHLRYGGHGGKTWILARIGRTGIFLINGKYSGELQRQPSSAAFIKLCSWKHTGNLTYEHWESLKQEILYEKGPKFMEDKISDNDGKGDSG